MKKCPKCENTEIRKKKGMMYGARARAGVTSITAKEALHACNINIDLENKPFEEAH